MTTVRPIPSLIDVYTHWLSHVAILDDAYFVPAHITRDSLWLACASFWLQTWML